mmetsp:Transcript_17244/g.19544  ORF Transcript_17244/g.19544 Transcript_17244/m.19544 type:complete len:221 (+) Transcript_17244:110-772(+)
MWGKLSYDTSVLLCSYESASENGRIHEEHFDDEEIPIWRKRNWHYDVNDVSKRVDGILRSECSSIVKEIGLVVESDLFEDTESSSQPIESVFSNTKLSHKVLGAQSYPYIEEAIQVVNERASKWKSELLKQSPTESYSALDEPDTTTTDKIQNSSKITRRKKRKGKHLRPAPLPPPEDNSISGVRNEVPQENRIPEAGGMTFIGVCSVLEETCIQNPHIM